MKNQFDQYAKLWAALKPAILEHMTALASCLTGQVPYAVSGPHISGPDEEFGSDEYRVTVDLKTEHDITVLSAEFQLRDGDDEGVQGFAVACELTGYNALVLGGFKPEAFSDDFFTLDQAVLERRVAEFDVYEFALATENALLDETLQKEVAEASAKIATA